ncbi:nucleoside hydrolase [Ruminococcaceae bacterium OttesenSCG-928-N02]|nr:nucleoside hydrolase [Ruminococcaceae bacterium OttesenSCG-928-N02]
MKLIVDTGFAGARAAGPVLQNAETGSILAITVAPSCHNHEEEILAVCETLKDTGAPIYAGAQRPTLRDDTPANTAPGTCGAPAPAPGHAVNAIIDAANANPGLTVLCLGPVTNLALALMKEPDLAQKIGKIIIAGGAQLGYSGVNEVAEYNIFCDPEAALTVFTCGAPVTMVPKEAADDYLAAATALCLGKADAAQQYDAFIDVDVSPSKTYGQTVVDPIGYNPITFEKHAGEKATVIAECTLKKEGTHA